MDEKTQVTHDYLVRNEGGTNLVIDRLRMASGCTATATPPIIAPASSGTIQARCDTANLSGTLTRTVTVYSNDPQQPVRTLSFKAKVLSSNPVVPSRLYVGHVRPGDSIRQELVMAGNPSGGTPHSANVIDAAWVRDDDTTTARVRVSVRRDAPPGRFTALLRIPTGNPRTPERVVPVVGTVDPPRA